MTVSSTSSRVVYAGNGSTTVFPFAFKVSQPADLAVVYTDPSGTDFILSPTQYAASGFGFDAGGSVTFSLPGGSPIATGAKLTIYRDVAVTQPTSLSNQGAMWPQVIEAALDRLTYVAQKVTDAVSRSLVVSPTDSAALGVLPNVTTRANSVLAFDAAGQPYAATLTGSLVSTATWLVNNLLPAGTSAQNACGVLGAAYLPGNNGFTGTNDFTAGRARVPTRAAGDSGTDAASTAFVKAKAESVVGGAVLRSYLAGLGLSNNTGSPNTKIDVAAGVCSDATNTQMMALSAGTIDGATVGANGLDAGSLANNTWYHVFAIGKADGTTALLASTSVGSPAMPSGYTLKRRIGSFRVNGSAQILAFTQNGDEFLWSTPVLDMNATAPPTTAALLTLTVPTGVKVDAVLGGIALGQSGNNSVLFSPPDAADVAPSATGTCSFNCNSNAWAVWRLSLRTNTSAQIRQRSNSTASLQVYGSTFGWIDRRGRDN
jgi:hypothetical protein